MDTVRLKFIYPKQRIRPDDLEAYFSEPILARTLKTMTGVMGGSRFIYTNNKWRFEEKAKGIYMPKYWLEPDYSNPEITYFVIELSLPKMLYGTNVIPLKETDRLIVAEKIQAFCKNIGVELFTAQILGTTPMAVAFGKNVDITAYTTASQAIGILSKFNDRFRSDFRIVYWEKGGVEIYGNSRTSTFKVYDKLAELKNNAITLIEQEMVEKMEKPDANGNVIVRQLLRAELTLKNSTAIKRRLQYRNKPPTFGSLFDESLWNELVKIEVERVFHHPFADFIFLSDLQANVINRLLKKYVRKHKTRLWVKDLVETIQRTGGTKNIKKYYFSEYRSRQTFYNHLRIAQDIASKLDPDFAKELSFRKFHSFFLEQFDINTSEPNTLF